MAAIRPPLKHHNPVGFLHGRKAVRHNNGGAVFRQPVNRRLHGAFAFGVQRACRLVQKQHWRIPQDRAGDGDPLFLSA